MWMLETAVSLRLPSFLSESEMDVTVGVRRMPEIFSIGSEVLYDSVCEYVCLSVCLFLCQKVHNLPIMFASLIFYGEYKVII